MNKNEVVRILREIGVLLELAGENPFKSRSYETAARSLEGVTGELKPLVETGGLYELKGIGKAIGEKVAQLTTSGSLPYYDELKAQIPAGLLDMTRIAGFGPKKARAVWQGLGIVDLKGLEKAAQEGKLAALAGFGEKSQGKILEGIAALRRHQGRFLISDAEEQVAPIVEALRAHKAVKRLELGGSLRRRRETIGDLDIVVSTMRPKEVMDRFVALEDVATVVAHGATKSSVTLKGGMNCDLRCVTDAEFPFALNYFTGSKEHNTALRQRARTMGLKLNEYGLYPGDSEKSLACRDEPAIYDALKLAYVEPEMREDMGEIAAAEKGELPRLIEESDLQGLVHFHTTASDGHNSLEEMALEAARRGYRYAAVCDHSQSAAYAGGLKPDDIKKQHEELERLRAKFKKLRLLKGIEADILGDGGFDYSNEILDSFDVVVASVHSRFSMPREEMTRRIVTAIESPCTTILGHPTGRLLLQRDGYEVDFEAIFEAAARCGVALEINANPQRLDLDWRHLAAAMKAGCKFSIGTDAHLVEGVADAKYGIGIARKGWLTKDDVINAWDVEKFLSWKKAARGRR